MSRFRRIHACLVVVCWSWACEPDSGSSSTGTETTAAASGDETDSNAGSTTNAETDSNSGSTTSDTETEGSSGVTCIDEDSLQVAPGVLTPCELSSPCDPVQFQLDDFGGYASCAEHTYDPEAAQCVLEAIRAGTVAGFEVDDCPGGQFSTQTQLQVNGNGTISWWVFKQQDLTVTFRETIRERPADEILDACDVETPQAFDACVTAMLEQPCSGDEPMCE